VKRAYQIVEELMILANELVAQWLTKKKCPTIYRVHAKPDEQKLERLERVCEKLGAPFDLDEMLEAKGVGKWLTRIAEHPKKPVLESLLLRSMKQAVYDITNVGHFGLASEEYLHFTSPIRRYPDVVVHRAVKHLARGGKVDASPNAVEQMRASATVSSTRERAAMEIEREVVDLYRALYMRDHVGDTFEGTVSAVVGSGLYVTLDEPFVDVLVRYESLGPDQYQASDDELAAVGVRSGDSVALGDRLLVTIEDVALLRRQVTGKRVVPAKVQDLIERESKDKRRGGKERAGGPRRAERAGGPPPKGERRASGRSRSGSGRSGKGRRR
jgi:ribonuclease R